MIININFVFIFQNFVCVIHSALLNIKSFHLFKIFRVMNISIAIKTQTNFSINFVELWIVYFSKFVADNFFCCRFLNNFDFSVICQQIIIHILNESCCQLSTHICSVNKREIVVTFIQSLASTPTSTHTLTINNGIFASQ